MTVKKSGLSKEEYAVAQENVPCDSCGRRDFTEAISCGVHMNFCCCDNPDCWKKHTTNSPGKGCFPVEL